MTSYQRTPYSWQFDCNGCKSPPEICKGESYEDALRAAVVIGWQELPSTCLGLQRHRCPDCVAKKEARLIHNPLAKDKTLLDYFAKGAMDNAAMNMPFDKQSPPSEFAKWCYGQAEAMLAERERRMKKETTPWYRPSKQK